MNLEFRDYWLAAERLSYNLLGYIYVFTEKLLNVSR